MRGLIDEVLGGRQRNRRVNAMKAAVTLPDAGADERAEMIRITGRVQGVGFRASAQHLALQYGVRGWSPTSGAAS